MTATGHLQNHHQQTTNTPSSPTWMNGGSSTPISATSGSEMGYSPGASSYNSVYDHRIINSNLNKENVIHSDLFPSYNAYNTQLTFTNTFWAHIRTFVSIHIESFMRSIDQTHRLYFNRNDDVYKESESI